MSGRRRAGGSGRDEEPPADQRVWGPADSGQDAYGPDAGGRRRGGGRGGAVPPEQDARGRRPRRDDPFQPTGRDAGGYDPASYPTPAYGTGYDGTGYDGAGQGGAGYDRAGYESAGYGGGHGARGPQNAGHQSAGYPPAGYQDGGYQDAGYRDAGYDDGREGRRGGRRDGRSPEGRADGRAHPQADDDLLDEDPPKRRRRRRGDDADDTGHASHTDAHGDGHGDGDGGSRRRRGGAGGGGKKGLGVVGWIAVVMTSVLVIGTLTAYKLYRDAFGLLNRTAGTDNLDTNRPENATGAINVLLVGSDSRAGDNKKYGQHLVNDGERTDTIMMLHVSPNRDTATLLSFPRDSMVMIPTCNNAHGVAVPAHMGMINSAFSDGGMICTRRTIESLTKIPVDHFVKVDFTGFKNIVNALGGIQICLPQAVNDHASKLTLSAGKHLVKGEQALAYVRLRHGLGDGSDISRIKRQQVFISQVVKKATSSALLTDIPKLTGFIQAAAKSVTMDNDLDAETLINIARSASKLSAKGFKATTVPWEAYPPNPNRVQWKQPDADNLFNAVRSDTQVTPTTPTPSAAASPGAKPSAPTVTKPQQVKVQVFNGTNTALRAKEVAEALSAQGFKVVGVGDARKPDGTDQPKTMVRYTGPGWDSAKILTGKLLNTVTPETGKAATGPVQPFTPSSPPPDAPKGRVPGPIIQLVIGADWQGVRTPLDLGDNAVTSETNPCSG
ncbi:LCP family protein [Microbispora sp. RL4-1S]|uniref:LCP family protein n=1 Tax=Microbispora oryzae TaxID=2806554 RepID=A0A941AKG3_9ACTN|nr:LCP family protein [Microbispora oryzae]MBP2706062.1 LCP family protein [Microbispora oryzae]